MSNVEQLLVIIDPTQGNEAIALDRALINAAIREPKPDIHILFITDPEAADLSADSSNVYKQTSWFFDLEKKVTDAGLKLHSQACLSTQYQEAILKYANDNNIGLMLIPTVGDKEAIKRSYSNQRWAILRKANCPVLLIKENQAPLREKLLVALKVQAKDEATQNLNKRVAERAEWACKIYGAELHVVNAYKDSMDYPDRAAIQRVINVESANIHVEEGKPEEILPRVAKEIGADGVLLGTRQKDGLGLLLKGHTTEKVLFALEQDVMVINA